MLVSLKELSGITVSAEDGDVGEVEDIYFDDRFWTIRFLVMDTHPWMPFSDKVLISPIAIDNFTSKDHSLKVSMTRDAVKDSPKIEEHETVSREFEKTYFDYFGYGYYWYGDGAWGQYAYPTALYDSAVLPIENIQQQHIESSNHLRSANEVNHYSIAALDGKKGYVKDFIWDTHTWSLRYLVVDTRDWLPGGKKVLISPDQFEKVNWGSKTVSCNINLAQIKACPEYQAEKLNDPEYLQQVRNKLQVNA
ncbi:PRC-barrel domain containing protein [Paraglaciecola sp. L3A3]|uniref:PRC-barrel domain containing protein n=1 Tax=Paraglaciecola sp. L3A3 TaxID=2686358 RepID=UPI00131C04DC|nr:PRC-barrel domain containing protein [Paraglaciecola sp. L3A3]